MKIMRKEQPSNIVVTGSIAQDVIYILPVLFSDQINPDTSHNISVSYLSENHQTFFGGSGANIAYTMGLLGMEPILFGSIGKTDLSNINHLSESGVNVDHLHKSRESTATFTVFTDKKNNQIGAFGGGAMYDSKSLVLASLLETIPDFFVLISPHDPKRMFTQVRESKKYGLRMCFDVGQQATNGSVQLLKEGINACEVLIVNDYEMNLICERTGWTKEQIIEKVPVCITTLGASGSCIEGNSVSGQIAIPVVPVKKVIDPTGAGDAYRAGFFFGYMKNLPLHICGQLGATAAAYAVERHGGQEHSFTSEEFLARYEQSFGPIQQNT